MKKKAGISTVMMILFLVLIMNRTVYAADFNASVSSANASQGENVSVTVTFSSGANIGAYAMKLTYDAGILEYVSGADGGGGGSVQFYNDYVNSTSKSYTVSFKAKTAGTSTLTLETISVPCDTDANDMTVKVSSGSVTVAAPAKASGNNNLSALNVALVYEDGKTESVALSPGFSAETTSYKLSAGANVTRLSLDVSAADGKAVVNVSGTRMDPGSNTTTITVTAENGDVKKYVIYTEKETAQETTTEKATETTAAQQETTQQQEETTIQEETTETQETQESQENQPGSLDVIIGGVNGYISDIPEDVQIPEGYESYTFAYNGNNIAAARGLSTDLVLVYIRDAQTEEGRFYIYNEGNGSFTPYVCITVRQHMYTIFDIPENVELPFQGTIGNEYQKLFIDIDGNSVEALKYDAEDLYLVYAMNWDGAYNLYYYDAKEGNFLRYQYTAMEKQEQNRVTVVTEDSTQKNSKSLTMARNIFAVLTICFAIIAVILGIMLYGKKRKAEPQVYEEYDAYAEYEEDVKPMDEKRLDKELDNILKRK